MTREFRVEHNLETGEVIEIELTDEELKKLSTDKLKVETELQVEVQKATEKAALLAQLGITADQAKLLLS
jgi:hypothetical protein